MSGPAETSRRRTTVRSVSLVPDQLALLQDHRALELSLLAAVEEDGPAEYGAVFTRPWVVELILDLAGFTADRDLAAMHAIEPACGDGAFLGPMVERLAESCARHGRPLADAAGALYACDLQPSHVESSRALIAGVLVDNGAALSEVEHLAAGWVHHDDFLLSDHRDAVADFVLGNPPYIRLEDVSIVRGAAYRQACKTMGGRADIFVGFYEVGLRALRPGGTLGFICADRWMRNQYGARLRQFVSERYAVEVTVEMHDVDAFTQDVSAYPSITILRRAEQGPAMVVNAHRAFDEQSAGRLRRWSHERPAHDPDFDAAELPSWFDGQLSWPAGSPERLALIAELERRLPPLQNLTTATKVGIGVATGADKVFITKDDDLVESEHLLPMAMGRDTMSGKLQWSGHYLVSPWAPDNSGLVDLADAPRMAAYFETHADALLKRNVATRRPKQWYRTIDRVEHTLTGKRKLLFPDIKATAHPVLDDGQTYPHHNLYWVTSDGWDIEVLGGLLLSRVAQMFIEAYAVKMRGGYFRFQAQYLRRIRVPEVAAVGPAARRQLRQAFHERDVERATKAALDLYEIDGLPR
jgi:adenine-specific DNA-methyltransferase